MLAFGKVFVAFQFKTKLQVKGLTHIFIFESHLTSYIINIFSFDYSHINAYVNLGWVKKRLTLNGNCDMNEIVWIK